MQQDTNLIRQTASQDEEGIGLIDVFHFIQNGWRTIASTGAFGLLIGCAYAFLAPQKFQAELLMQGALVAGQPVEAAATLVEKLKQPTYYSQKTVALCIDNGPKPTGLELAKRLKATTVKNAPLVSITYKARTADSAKECLNAVLLDIQENQAELPKPLIKVREAQLQLSKQHLEQSEKITHQLTHELNRSAANSSALLSSILLSKQNDLATLRKSIEAQEMELIPPQTQPASAATPIYASDTPVSPKRPVAILGGLLGGVVLGILWLLARQGWLKLKAQLHHT
jgi:capsular polysaccharide biosynthesis protein